MTINHFTYPSLNGIKFPRSFTCISSKDGYFVKYHESSEENMTPNAITIADNAFSFDLYYGRKSLKPILYFTTTNPIP